LPAAGRATARLQLPRLFEDFQAEEGVAPRIGPNPHDAADLDRAVGGPRKDPCAGIGGPAIIDRHVGILDVAVVTRDGFNPPLDDLADDRDLAGPVTPFRNDLPMLTAATALTARSRAGRNRPRARPPS
jgi:hypothetical protein